MAAIGIGWLYHINNMSKTARHHFIHTLMDNRDLDEAINDDAFGYVITHVSSQTETCGHR